MTQVTTKRLYELRNALDVQGAEARASGGVAIRVIVEPGTGPVWARDRHGTERHLSLRAIRYAHDDGPAGDDEPGLLTMRRNPEKERALTEAFG